MNALDKALALTLFRSLTKTVGRVIVKTLRQLAATLGDGPECRDKSDQPLFSGARFDGDHRSTETVRSVSAIVGDHDAGTLTPSEAADMLVRCGVAGIIVTTFQHMPDKPRWRVVVPLSKPVNASEALHWVRVLNHLLGGTLAGESETIAQAWFYGRPAGAKPLVLLIEGNTLDDAAEWAFEAVELPCKKAEQPTAHAEAVAAMPAQRLAPVDALAEIPWEPAPDTADERERVKQALRCIDPDCGNHEYLTVCSAVISTDWGDAHAILEDWASGRMHGYAAGKYDERAHHRRVKKLMPDGGVTLGSLFALAARHGFNTSRTPPAAQLDTFGDISNGTRFAGKFRGLFLFVHAVGKWMRFDGVLWRWCDSGEALKAARVIAAEALDDAHAALRADPTERAKSNHGHALAVHRNARRLDAMLTIAATEECMRITHPGLLDADPMLLGVRNGVLNLRTGTLLEADPAMLISRQAGAAYHPDAQCPQWLAFLVAVFDGDADVIAFVQRALGYSLTGLVDEEVMFFLLGAGANGKSVFANVVQAIFGEYAVTVRAALLARDAKGNGSDAEREKARLPGARMALINEVGLNDAWDDQRLKELVSRERISARMLYGESFDFMPSHAIWMRGNHQPVATDAGDGFWRRMVLIRFGRQFAESERVPDLDRRILDAERDGVLAWMVEGCLAWQRDGLRVPDSIKSESDAYRKDSDLLGEWLDTHCDRDLQAETPIGTLFDSYRSFLTAGGMRAPSSPVFGRQVSGRGFKTRQSNGRRLVQGLAVRSLEGWHVSDQG